jgi:hypothetical protein
MNKAPDQRVAGRSWASIRSTVAPAVIEHGSQAFLRHAGASRWVMLERDWPQLYIRGVTPEDAANQAYAHYWITHAFEHGQAMSAVEKEADDWIRTFSRHNLIGSKTSGRGRAGRLVTG